MSPALYEKYEKYNFESFVNLSKHDKWCPGRSCHMIIEVKKEQPVDCFCECGENFCFGCLKMAHTPITCELLLTWLDRIGGDNEQDTANWLKINTKPCPKCKTNIEKNQGCMHMTCRKCTYEFCWLCLGDYKKH